MQNTDLERFKTLWDHFITRLHGQMLHATVKQHLTGPMMQLMLADGVDFWDSRQQEGGRWLDQYETANPQKGARIRSILVKDMSFSIEEDAKSRAGILKLALPLGSAAAGLLVSHLSGASAAIRIISTVAPTVVSYPIAVSLIDAQNSSTSKSLIQNYLNQLEKYRQSVESVLSEC